MKKLILSTCLFFTAPAFAVNTVPAFVESLETRDTGYHAVYLSESVPSQNCTLPDRAVVDENDVGSKTQFSALLAALASGKKVVVGVDGCVQIGVDSPATTAPRVVKVHLYRN